MESVLFLKYFEISIGKTFNGSFLLTLPSIIPHTRNILVELLANFLIMVPVALFIKLCSSKAPSAVMTVESRLSFFILSRVK